MSAPETPAPGAALEFVPRTHLGPQPWNDFVYASPDGWLGAVYEWLDMTAGVEEWRIADLSFGVRQGGRLVALMPLGYSPTIRRMSPGSLPVTASRTCSIVVTSSPSIAVMMSPPRV